MWFSFIVCTLSFEHNVCTHQKKKKKKNIIKRNTTNKHSLLYLRVKI